MNIFKKMNETEQKQYHASEGYTYKYSPDMPEIKIVAREKDVFEVIDFQHIKTTFVADALCILMFTLQTDKLTIRFHGYSGMTIPISKQADSVLDISVTGGLQLIYHQLEAIDLCDVRYW